MRPPREIARALPKGYKVGFPLEAKSGHPYVLCPDGTVLRDTTGMPIKVSITPANFRTTRNDVARIRRALGGGKR